MSKESPLKGKVVLVVDDEPDVLETVEDLLDMCEVHKAQDFDTALRLILSNTYDAVILDIMGVNGFELLKNSVARDFPTLMLTAHAMTTEALSKSMKIGAVSFLPKELMKDLEELLEDLKLISDVDFILPEEAIEKIDEKEVHINLTKADLDTTITTKYAETFKEYDARSQALDADKGKRAHQFPSNIRLQ